MVNQPQFKSVIGDFKLCAKMRVFDNKLFAEMQSKLHGSEPKKAGKKAEKQQEPKVKAPKQPKEEKDDEPAAPALPKAKDPLDALPAG